MQDKTTSSTQDIINEAQKLIGLSKEIKSLVPDIRECIMRFRELNLTELYELEYVYREQEEHVLRYAELAKDVGEYVERICTPLPGNEMFNVFKE